MRAPTPRETSVSAQPSNLFAVPAGSAAERSLMPPTGELERIRVADRDVGRIKSSSSWVNSG
jgi:hypothetical protein